jgi:hypothetical protein
MDARERETTMDGDARGAASTMTEGAHSQVLFRDGAWWHWRWLSTLGCWVPVTGRDPEPTRRSPDVGATRARVELAAQLGGAR